MSNIIFNTNINIFFKKHYFSNNDFFFNFKKKKFIYYDYVFFLISTFNCNFNANLMNIFKNFISFLYNIIYMKFKFFILDSDFKYSNIFNYFIFNDNTIIKFNNFIFFKNNKMRNQYSFLIFKKFIVESKISLLVVLDYEFYFYFIRQAISINLFIFSFIPLNYFNKLIDFYLISYNGFIFLQKFLLISKIFQIWNIANFNFLKKNISLKTIKTHKQ